MGIRRTFQRKMPIINTKQFYDDEKHCADYDIKEKEEKENEEIIGLKIVDEEYKEEDEDYNEEEEDDDDEENELIIMKGSGFQLSYGINQFNESDFFSYEDSGSINFEMDVNEEDEEVVEV